MTENKTSLMDKNVNDLTVGDALKINLAVVGACVAVPFVIYGVTTVTDKVNAVRAQRKATRAEKNSEQ
jgi:hypothetical protein